MSEGEMLQLCYDAMYSEYMYCPLCTGHIGPQSNYHDEYCELARYNMYPIFNPGAVTAG